MYHTSGALGLHPKNNQEQLNQTTNYSDSWLTWPYRAIIIQCLQEL